ncbi:MAG: hypothetical protein ACXWKP_04670, partial [Bradyrhizobium sp.]
AGIAISAIFLMNDFHYLFPVLSSRFDGLDNSCSRSAPICISIQPTDFCNKICRKRTSHTPVEPKKSRSEAAHLKVAGGAATRRFFSRGRYLQAGLVDACRWQNFAQFVPTDDLAHSTSHVCEL